MSSFFERYGQILFLCLVVALLLLFFVFLPNLFSEHYILNENLANTESISAITKIKPVFIPSYVSTPMSVKGIYMTSWTAGTPNLRAGLVKLIDQTELNTVVIDIKDYSGKIVFPVENSTLKVYGSEEVRVNDLGDFIEKLHKKGIYVIGRIAVFQDAYFVKYRPDLAVKNKKGDKVWEDYKGISWIDPSATEYWDYIVLLAKESRKIGFDEINFDYIRFPSDGNMEDISYPWSSTTPKTTVLKNFFQYLHHSLAPQSVTDVISGKVEQGSILLKISADLFGMTTTATDDMGIGQVLEDALSYFDYISPMVYPSHYPPNFEGLKEPEAHPYEIVYFAMKSAVERTEKASMTSFKLRPWLQDFGLKMDYGPLEVRAQIKATEDVGLNSWILWSAGNKYTKGALDDK